MDKKTIFQTKKSLGQNFLNNTRIPELMADAGAVEVGDIILEIGPGTGALTKELLKRGAHVIALEADERAIDVLKDLFLNEIHTKQLTLVHGDARAIDVRALGLRPRAFKTIANIPYYLSGMLFRTLLESDIHPSDLVFLVQKEVAERIARDKKESLLSLSVKVFGNPRYVKTVGKGNFTPPPKIDSAIIAITDISHTQLQQHNLSKEHFFFILHQGFKSKRKQLLGNFADTYDRAHLERVFSTLSLPLTVRGEDVPLHTWLDLSTILK